MDFEDPRFRTRRTRRAVMSKETSIHYEKHHKTYMTNLKGLLEGKPEAQKTWWKSFARARRCLHNAAQCGITFFLESIARRGRCSARRDVADLVNAYGGWDKVRTISSQPVSAASARVGLARTRRYEARDHQPRPTRKPASTSQVRSPPSMCGSRLLHRHSQQPKAFLVVLDKLLNWTSSPKTSSQALRRGTTRARESTSMSAGLVRRPRTHATLR